MARLLVLYGTPANREAFDEHYRDVHIPLARSLPGLRRYTVSQNAAPIRGGELYYLVAELDWDDVQSLQQSLGSPAGQAAAEDVEKLISIGGGTVHGMIFDVADA